MALKSTVDEVTGDVIRLRYLFVDLYFGGAADGWVPIDAGSALADRCPRRS